MKMIWRRVACAISRLLLIGLLSVLPPVMAGKGPYAEFKDTVIHDAVEVLKKHGMPVRHDRENPWVYISGIPGSYTLTFHQADEVPQQAVLDVTKLCMDFYDQRGRKERFRIRLYRESQKTWRESLFLGIGALEGVKPFFELTIGRKD